MLKINKKLLAKSVSFVLVPTLLFSMASCSNGTLLKKKKMLETGYYCGYYLYGSCLDDMLVAI